MKSTSQLPEAPKAEYIESAAMMLIDEPEQEGACQYHKAIDGIAEYFLVRILEKTGRLNAIEAKTTERFAELAADEFNQEFVETTLRRAQLDAADCGYELRKFSQKIAKTIAEEFREELEPLAVEFGYIKQGE